MRIDPWRSKDPPPDSPRPNSKGWAKEGSLDRSKNSEANIGKTISEACLMEKKKKAEN